jgi:RimJ/RimL family protein N-acetyltransferase
MTIHVDHFDPATDYEPVAALTGDTPDELRAFDARHDPPRPRWVARRGVEAIGVLDVWTSPDGRHRMYFDVPTVRPDVYRALADAAVAALGGAGYANADAGDAERLAALAAAGFGPSRREHRFAIPVRRLDAPVPGGIEIRSAADVSPLRLLALDVAVRQLIPGSDGWTADPLWFEEETFGSPDFDPRTYLVACDGPALVGLCRVWRGRVPRLGCVAVLPGHQRRGLALAMLSPVFDVLADEGVARVTSEADVTNAASMALHARLGATVTGDDLELVRRP